MKIQEFEAELQKLDRGFSIRRAPNNPEMSGIYWKDLYICGVPSGYIYDELRPDYKNSVGIAHRTRPVAYAQAKRYIERIRSEPGFAEDEMSFARGE
jgi:hypothetical protein